MADFIFTSQESLWHEDVDDRMIESVEQYTKMAVQYQPKLIVLGEVVHTILHYENNVEMMVDDYRRNVTKLRKLLDKLKRPIVIWMLNQGIIESRLGHSLRFVSNELINRLNFAAVQALYDQLRIFCLSLSLSIEQLLVSR